VVAQNLIDLAEKLSGGTKIGRAFSRFSRLAIFYSPAPTRSSNIDVLLRYIWRQLARSCRPGMSAQLSLSGVKRTRCAQAELFAF
jgi:hypothetical protein